MTTSTIAPPAQAPVDRVADVFGAPEPFESADWTLRDIGDARRQLEGLYEGRDFRSRQGPDSFSFRFASAGDARLQLQTGTFRGYLQGVIPWSRDYVMSWFRAGSVTIDYPAGQLTSVGARPFLTPTETSFSFSMTPHRHGIVHINAAFLESIAAESHGGLPQRVVFDYAAIPTDATFAKWRRTLGAVTPLIINPGASELARLTAQTRLVRSLLDLFPWHAVDVPEAFRTERTRRLRLAAEYAHAFADQPITTADIAAAAGLHVRSLQQAMNEHLGSSPTAYLRNVRLDRVRQDLLSGEPATTRVADVAADWGFGNLGRFAAAYARRFGEYPRETLSR